MDRRDASGVTAKVPIGLTIAGSDSGGGAGVQADLKTFAAVGVYGACAITAVTAQNTLGVSAIHYAPPEIVAAQIKAVRDDFSVAAIKIGMLGTAEIVNTVAEALRSPSPRSRGEGWGAPPSPRGRGEEVRPPFLIYDPVMIASSGDSLSGKGFVEAIKRELLPLVDCLTPNLAEAAALTSEPAAANEDEMARQGRALLALGPRAVLLKGGHLAGDEAIDLLVTPEGVFRFSSPKIAARNLHGSGCVLSSAIAAHIVLGAPLSDAVAAAKAFTRQAIKAGRDLGLGAGPGPLVPTPLATPNFSTDP